MGSNIASGSNSNSSNLFTKSGMKLGLPNTNNIFEKWADRESSPRLRASGVLMEPPHVTATTSSQFVGDGLGYDGSASFHAGAKSYVITPNIDSVDLLVAAWIYLGDHSVNTLRTVFANKQSGCGTGVAQHGIALYVNAWQTNDAKLYVEYGGSSSGGATTF